VAFFLVQHVDPKHHSLAELVVDEYNHTEKRAVPCDITAVFSPADDPSAKALAVGE
jgi:hypothetical protein